MLFKNVAMFPYAFACTRTFKINIFKVLFLEGGSGSQKEYSGYGLDNDNSG